MGTEKSRSASSATEATGAIRATMRVLADRRTEVRAIEDLTDTEVRSVQRALLAAGFDPGPYDGRMGPRVRAAVGAFQEANGIEPCRCLDGETLDALGLRVRIVQTRVGDAAPPDVEILMPRRPVRDPVLPEPAEPEDPEPDTTATGGAAGAASTGVQGIWGLLPGRAGRGVGRPAPSAPSGRPLGRPASGRLLRGRPSGSGGNRSR